MNCRAFTTQLLRVMAIVALVCLAGCALTFKGSLPLDLNASLAYVLEQREAFAQASNGTGDPATGTVVDDLSGLSGCWGAFVEAISGQGPNGQIDHYSAKRLGPDGSLTTWDLADIGGYYAVVWEGRGRYEVVGNNRLRFTIEQDRSYNPLTRAYETYDAESRVTEYLATLDGEILRLRMLWPPGAAPPAPSEPDYTVTYRAFGCWE